MSSPDECSTWIDKYNQIAPLPPCDAANGHIRKGTRRPLWERVLPAKPLKASRAEPAPTEIAVHLDRALNLPLTFELCLAYPCTPLHDNKE
jgi:hypothetical protein